MAFQFSVYITLASLIAMKSCAYKLEFADRLCEKSNDVRIRLEETGANSALILSSAEGTTHKDSLKCTIVIESPLGSALLVGGIRKIDFYSDNCKNRKTFLEVTQVTQASTGKISISEGIHYCTKVARDAGLVSNLVNYTIKYVTASFSKRKRAGFQAIFTVHKNSKDRRCSEKDFDFDCSVLKRGPAYCISKSYVCDGISNCGTELDENKGMPTYCTGALLVEAKTPILLVILTASTAILSQFWRI